MWGRPRVSERMKEAFNMCGNWCALRIKLRPHTLRFVQLLYAVLKGVRECIMFVNIYCHNSQTTKSQRQTHVAGEWSCRRSVWCVCGLCDGFLGMRVRVCECFVYMCP